MSITELSQRLQNGSLTASELVRRCLTKIDEREAQIRAWVSVDRDGALVVAKELDEELAKGHSRGPLHGIPIGVKDIIDVRGWPTRAGSSLSSERLAANDAPVVARLRAAGAVILGKTVTTEYASFDPPPTRNPWNLDRTPGGSSSGSAAAVAAGMCVAALGSQTGGSITRPASYCGVYGFKPTIGRLSLEGIVPFSAPLDHPGPIASCVADLKLLFHMMSDAAEVTDSPQTSPLRIGVIESYFLEQADPEVAAATRAAAARLQLAGANVSVVPLPASFSEVHARHLTLMAYGAASVHRDQFAAHGAQYGREIATLIRKGQAVDEPAYHTALDHQQKFRTAMADCFAGVDLLVTPSTPTPAPTRETTGSPMFNSPWSYSGLPTVSVPCAVSRDGLPMSLQLIGPFGSDDRLLTAAAWVEERLGFEAEPKV